MAEVRVPLLLETLLSNRQALLQNEGIPFHPSPPDKTMLRRHFLTAHRHLRRRAHGLRSSTDRESRVEDAVGRWIETTPGVTGEQGYVFAADGR